MLLNEGGAIHHVPDPALLQIWSLRITLR